uniref:Uncharacterized protein n=1 Tax=Utricularia reniformis TaxID=192314 RepID=A0A1Y0B228_9LAMI|nr:hypothetical protein AEK19_MT1209 [Utricularia reniformis]ART31423.1 hypothetical protein AEK19_MT1209 [Utricularia reniformis]
MNHPIHPTFHPMNLPCHPFQRQRIRCTRPHIHKTVALSRNLIEVCFSKIQFFVLLFNPEESFD